ncbi:band 7 family protein [Desulfovibrio ferrophilus]|uniref:Band 7 family protein n=1 Tax=Desulfovibrio ferrophilus TaxID=241368 RepID=A0A2Z6B1V6_9BACT|nr:band 7 family protein [Desulfovibrio ferrophilus]
MLVAFFTRTWDFNPIIRIAKNYVTIFQFVLGLLEPVLSFLHSFIKLGNFDGVFIIYGVFGEDLYFSDVGYVSPIRNDVALFVNEVFL